MAPNFCFLPLVRESYFALTIEGGVAGSVQHSSQTLNRHHMGVTYWLMDVGRIGKLNFHA